MSALAEWAEGRRQTLWVLGLAVVTLAGLLWRLALAANGDRPTDEEICIGLAEQVLRPGGHWPLHGGDHPALGIYLVAASAWVFGPSLLGYRLLGVVAGALTIPLLALTVARSASRREALPAAALLAANPFHAGLSAIAIEIPFQVFFVTLAWLFLASLPAGGRRALVGSAAALGLGFMCSESTALVAVGWLAVLALRPGLRAGLRPRDYLFAGAAGLAVVAPDLVYNATATRPDFRYVNYLYVNYLDHLRRIATPAFGLQGIGFFLRDAFNAVLGDVPRWWTDFRCEYSGPGIALGILLLAGWLHSFHASGDPSAGLWSLPTLLFVFVATFTGPTEPYKLDPPSWTWPVPTLTLVTAGAARLLVMRWRRAWPVFLVLLGAMLLPAPTSFTTCR